MATSTTQVAPAKRRAAYQVAIASLQAQGVPVTAEAVHRLVGGRRGNVQRYVKAWKAAPPEAGAGFAAQETAPDVGEALAVPLPPLPPILPRLAQARQARMHALEQLQREVQQDSLDVQAARFAARQALEALRTATRRAQQAPPHAMVEAFAVVTTCTATLATYVGAEAAQRAADDQTYTPAGL